MSKLAKIRKFPVIGNAMYSLYMKHQAHQRHINNVKRVQELIIPQGKKVLYLDIPIHSNLGDLAQYVCAKKWIQENYLGYEYVEIDGLIISDLKCGMVEKIARSVSSEDIIFFQSGYCTQDIGGYHDIVHKRIIETCPNTPIVMLPQTVLYKHKENSEAASTIYKKHGRILFLARDFSSEKIARELFPTLKVESYPDIVTTMIGVGNKKETNREGVIFCIRNDSEKFYGDEEINLLINKLENIVNVSVCDTTIREKFETIRPHLTEYIDKIVDQFTKAKVVVTDRYHGTIFALIAGTPVVVIKTTDHKVKTGVDWFKGIYDDYAFFADSLEEAEKIVIDILKKDLTYSLQPYFKQEYYDVLKDKIEIWLQSSSR